MSPPRGTQAACPPAAGRSAAGLIALQEERCGWFVRLLTSAISVRCRSAVVGGDKRFRPCGATEGRRPCGSGGRRRAYSSVRCAWRPVRLSPIAARPWLSGRLCRARPAFQRSASGLACRRSMAGGRGSRACSGTGVPSATDISICGARMTCGGSSALGRQYASRVPSGRCRRRWRLTLTFAASGRWRCRSSRR